MAFWTVSRNKHGCPLLDKKTSRRNPRRAAEVFSNTMTKLRRGEEGFAAALKRMLASPSCNAGYVCGRAWGAEVTCP